MLKLKHKKILFIICALSCANYGLSNEQTWVTYKYEDSRDPKHNFTIQHPADMKVIRPAGLSVGVIQFRREENLSFNLRIAPFVGGRVGYKTGVYLSSELTLEELLTICVASSFKYGCSLETGYMTDIEVRQMTKMEKVAISGLDGLQAKSSTDPCLNKRLPISLLIHQNTRYFFEKCSGRADEYQKMLNTFRFLD